MRRRARVYGPYRHGDRWRVHFVTGSGGDRKTTYETFDSESDAQSCYDGAHDEAQGVTVIAAIEQYLDYKRAQGRAELTIVAYRQRLTLLLGPYLNRPVRSIAKRGGALYAAALVGRKPDSHQNLLAAGRFWAAWCVSRKLLKANPFSDVEMIGQRVHGGDKERLTIDESRQLEAWCFAHLTDPGAVVTLCYLYLGSRNSELGRRNVRDLDDGGRLLRIGKTKTRAGRRALRIPEELAEVLVGMVADRPPDAPLFIDSRGNRMSRYVARNLVRRTCDAAEVPVIPPQALRRTHADIADGAGETGYAIARALGHTTGAAPVVTTRSYIGKDATEASRGATVLRVIRGGRG